MINIISSCTNSKKQIAVESLKIANLESDMSLDKAIQIWNNNIKKKEDTTHKALEVYKGGAWQSTIETKDVLSVKFQTNLYIASAGYGLISSDEEICPYDSTFASSTVNSISKFINNSNSEANIRWWDSINMFDNSSFLEESYFFIVLPHNYLIASQRLTQDLIKKFNKKVFIFTANKHSTPLFMKNNIIQFDSSFNNFEAGILSNMLQRAVLWLSNEIVKKNIPLIHSNLQDHINLEMSQYDTFTMPIRKKLTEEEILKKIEDMILIDAVKSASQGLKLFRKNGFACEQKRFGKLFKEVKGK